MTTTAPASPKGGPDGANDVITDIPLSLKATLVDDEGISYRAFRRTLTPRWGLIALHIVCGYVGLIALLAAVVLWAEVAPQGIALTILAGIGVGFTLEYLSNFFHEAAHYNLMPRRRWNDRAANILIAWMFGTSIQPYRQVHWGHHRYLGTTMDTETSYFDPLGVRYLLAGLTGLKAVRTLRRWREVDRRVQRRGQAQGRGLGSRLWWIGVAVGTDLGVAAVLWLALDAPLAAAAWLWGVLFVFPCFGSLRQLLEHRADDAHPDIDYTQVDHGAVNRLFGDGPLASTFGSAGFNRHALHHWEPQLSYTRLAELEEYLLRTPLAPVIRERQTTYAETVLRLLTP
jgi:fatty acid desaturase